MAPKPPAGLENGGSEDASADNSPSDIVTLDPATMHDGERKVVRAGLASALASPDMSGSKQLCDFLTFIVERSLDGRADEIKAYSIAVDALGRSENFDPQTSAAVRVAAGRLRQALALHNATVSAEVAAGEVDRATAIIRLEPGSYVPGFELLQPGTTVASRESGEGAAPVEAPVAQPASAGPGMASPAIDPSPVAAPRLWLPWLLLPFIGALIAVFSLLAWIQFAPERTLHAAGDVRSAQAGTLRGRAMDELARPRWKTTLLAPDDSYPAWFRLEETHDALVTTAARFDDFEFAGSRLAQEPLVTDPRQADYHLVITLRAQAPIVRAYAQLVREADGTVLWTLLEDYAAPDRPEARDLAVFIGERVSPIASPYGVIYTDLLRQQPERGGLDCQLNAYRYFYDKSDGKHASARACSEEMIERDTRLPGVHAGLTFLYLDELREGRNRRARNPLRAAERMARRAAQLGPTSARAHQALFAVAKVAGDVDEARRTGSRALRLNPVDTDIIGDYGAWLVSQGDGDEGLRLMERADKLLATRPAWLEAHRYVAFWLTGDEDRAQRLARSLDPQRAPMTAMMILMQAGNDGQAQGVTEAVDALRQSEPGALTDPAAELRRRGFSKRMADMIGALILGGAALVPQPEQG